MSICAPSPWPYHQLMNMHDHFSYCMTLAKQTVIEGGFSSSLQHKITVGKWCSIRVQTGDQGKCFAGRRISIINALANILDHGTEREHLSWLLANNTNFNCQHG